MFINLYLFLNALYSKVIIIISVIIIIIILKHDRFEWTLVQFEENVTSFWLMEPLRVIKRGMSEPKGNLRAIIEEPWGDLGEPQSLVWRMLREPLTIFVSGILLNLRRTLGNTGILEELWESLTLLGNLWHISIRENIGKYSGDFSGNSGEP